MEHAAHAAQPLGAGRPPCPRWAHTAVCFGSRVLIFGGSAPARCFKDLHWFDTTNSSWQLLTPTSGVKAGQCPAARSGHCACAVGPLMFVFGGNTTLATFNDLWQFDTASAAWSLVRAYGPTPSGRVGHTITAVGRRLLVLGGREYATNRFDNALHSSDAGPHTVHLPSVHTADPVHRVCAAQVRHADEDVAAGWAPADQRWWARDAMAAGAHGALHDGARGAAAALRWVG